MRSQLAAPKDCMHRSIADVYGDMTTKRSSEKLRNSSVSAEEAKPLVQACMLNIAKRLEYFQKDLRNFTQSVYRDVTKVGLDVKKICADIDGMDQVIADHELTVNFEQQSFHFRLQLFMEMKCKMVAIKFSSDNTRMWPSGDNMS